MHIYYKPTDQDIRGGRDTVLIQVAFRGRFRPSLRGHTVGMFVVALYQIGTSQAHRYLDCRSCAINMRWRPGTASSALFRALECHQLAGGTRSRIRTPRTLSTYVVSLQSDGYYLCPKLSIVAFRRYRRQSWWQLEILIHPYRSRLYWFWKG
jgi:hypothetical protein